MTEPLTRSQRDRKRRRRDRRWQLAVGALAIACGLIAALVTSPRLFFGDEPSGDDHNGPPLVADTTRTTLVLHRSADGRINLAMLAAVSPRSQQASVLFIPAATVIEVPALGPQAIATLLGSDDAKSASTNISNALGLRIDRTVIVDTPAISAMFAATRRVVFSVPEAVTLANGALSVPAGDNAVASSVAAQLFVGREATGEVAHYVTVQSILEGWFAQLREDPTATAAVGAISGGAAFATLAGYGDALQYETLPVASVAAGDTERYEIREPQTSALLKERFAKARLGVHGERVRFELLNGVGRPGLVQAVANVVVPAGANVVLTGNSVRFDQTTTRVVYYRDEDAATARRFAQILGVGGVARGAAAVSVVDITVVIGKDLADKLDR